MAENEKSKQEYPYCSFCGKSDTDVKRLIAGVGVHICNECVDICVDIIAEDVEGGEEQKLMEPIGKEEKEMTVSALRLALRRYHADAVFVVREKSH